MATLVFPTSPSTGDKFPTTAAAGFNQWEWDGEKWVLLVKAAEAAPSTGTPDAPVLSADLSWTVPADHGSAIIGYEIWKSDPAITVTQNKPAYAGAVCKHDGAHTIDYAGLTITPATSMKASGTTPFTDYTFKVRAINGNGAGAWSNEITRQFNFNEATGGTVNDVPDYNGATGETWRVHTFTGNGTFTVSQSLRPFRVLVQSAGGGGQSVGGGVPGNAHGSGGAGVQSTETIAVGAHAVHAAPGSGGNGSGGGRCVNGGGQPGGVSTFLSHAPAGGAGGGCPGAGGHINGPISDITGTSIQYGGFMAGNPGDGHAGNGNGNGAGGGWAGVVIVAYQIA